MDVIHVANDKLGLFIGGVRIEVLQELEEHGYECWEDPDVILPFAVCESIFDEVANQCEEGWDIAQCEFSLVFDKLSNYAAGNMEAFSGWEES